MSERFDAFNATAIRCHGKPEGWKWHTLDARDVPSGYTKVSGSVPTGVFKSGPRKGQPKWTSDPNVVWMRNVDIAETKRLWEIENDKCIACYGTGKYCHRVSVNPQTKEVERGFRKCSKCEGTGKPTSEASE